MASRKFDPKKNVWVPDPEEGFVAAEIRRAKDESQLVVVTERGQQRVVMKEEAQLMNPPKFELIGGWIRVI